MTSASTSIHFTSSQLRALMERHGCPQCAEQLALSVDEEVQMEGRIARLESDVAHIQQDVAEMKADLKSLDGKIDGLRDKMDGSRDKMDSLRDKMESGFTDVRRAIAQLNVAMERAYGKARFATLETRVWGLSTLGAVLLLMARAFKWI